MHSEFGTAEKCVTAFAIFGPVFLLAVLSPVARATLPQTHGFEDGVISFEDAFLFSTAKRRSLAAEGATFIEEELLLLYIQATHRRVNRSNGDADTKHRESLNITSLGSTIAVIRTAFAGKRFRVEVHLKLRETVFASSWNVGTVRDRAKQLWPELLGIPSKTREVGPFFKTPSSNIGG